MRLPAASPRATAFNTAALEIENAAAAQKCWTCGCLQGSLAAIGLAVPEGERPPRLANAVLEAVSRLLPPQYDCLGCEVCFPAIAVNALSETVPALDTPSEECVVESTPRAGWPPLAGSYRALRYHAPVAVCCLTSNHLSEEIAREAGEELSVVGTLQTENLGIERVVTNILANPNIRFLVVCGEDSRKLVGHFPGQSLVALAANGLDRQSKIVGAQGRRPVLRNVSFAAVAHFRRWIEVVDLVGLSDLPRILEAARGRAATKPEPAEPFDAVRSVAAIEGTIPAHMTADPSGWFVVFVDRGRGNLVLEHYRCDGLLDTVIEARSAAEAYCPAIEQGLLSRLDHAAYLGRELARAEKALLSGDIYIQDAAPERASAIEPGPGNCGSGCSEVCE